MKPIRIVLSALFALLISGCATVEKSPESKPVQNDVVRISLQTEVIIAGRIVCHIDRKPPAQCTKAIVHPEESLLMLTIADGKYRLIPPIGVKAPYYDVNPENREFAVRTEEGGVVGKCLVRLQKILPVLVYLERCEYKGVVVSVVTSRDPIEKKLLSMYGTIASGAGVRQFVVN